ncbi:type II toxin-antitoxin system Phd/YefM family antitoxin [bacterium]|nr:type II toxin-antitoxin system Phd/YefM family antitoxin [bacterium]OIO88107.1 MAG: hypothetical protein AUK02_04200 [Anaerolineae bacterium CG2_30_58_95]PIW20640.1 MAG: hypothetical protein COW33_01570 [Anaerolineae bacterium CG17_big_fil_post_rev_8_21_14_2_50_57_27]PJH75673.1 MAG: hypothetical protein CO064_05400 [Anaerolineae bacterium CG_4_9_14_0_8_um_filter_58_9]
MDITINLAEARRKLPELADRAGAGQTYVVSRRGRKIAVLIGVDEYQRYKAIELQQRERDFNVLLAPAPPNAPTEDQARSIAVQIVRKARTERSERGTTNAPLRSQRGQS